MTPNRPLSQEEYDDIARDLAALREHDLGDWDREFVESCAWRMAELKRFTRFSARQLEQLERMRMQYL